MSKPKALLILGETGLKEALDGETMYKRIYNDITESDIKANAEYLERSNRDPYGVLVQYGYSHLSEEPAPHNPVPPTPYSVLKARAISRLVPEAPTPSLLQRIKAFLTK